MNDSMPHNDALRWRDCPIAIAALLFFDIETTGLRPDRGGRITEMAVLDASGERFRWSTDVNAADPDASRQLPTMFQELRSGVVVGHNVAFDMGFTAYVANRAGFDGPNLRYIDTLAMARKLITSDDYRLGALAEKFDLHTRGQLHTAVGDARLTRSLFWRLVDIGNLETLTDAGMKPVSWTTF